ncbi:MAG: type I-D CRISPR-associated protein Cas5/Csc1 [Methanosarcinales archaeon]
MKQVSFTDFKKTKDKMRGVKEIKKTFTPVYGYVCNLETLDYIMYTSRDYGSLVVTDKNVINNYALGYALGSAVADSKVYPVSLPSVNPCYDEDFSDLDIYITPAISVDVTTKTKTYNTIPERYYERTYNSYSKIFPTYGRYEMIAPESIYTFTIFSEEEIKIPKYIKLGKFKAPCKITVIEKGNVVRKIKKEYHSEALHINDLPENTHFVQMIAYIMIRLGKSHAILTNLMFSGEFLEIQSESHRKIPVGTKFCNQKILP